MYAIRSYYDLLNIAAGGAGATTAGVQGSVVVHVLNETTTAGIAADAAINATDPLGGDASLV